MVGNREQIAKHKSIEQRSRELRKRIVMVLENRKAAKGLWGRIETIVSDVQDRAVLDLGRSALSRVGALERMLTTFTANSK